MQMNKLYLLVALGLSVKASEAGDCLDPATFDSSLGMVDFNCGSACGYSGTGGGGGGTVGGCTNYYSNYCADDDYMC
jgi:hypothetical protein